MVNGEKIKNWILAKSTLDAAKVNEMALRVEICNEVLQGHQKGVKHKIIDGFKTSATAKLNQNIDEDLLSAIYSDLSPAEKSCLKVKHSIISKPYNQLDAKSKLHRVIDEKPGTPSLTIKPV